jgi:hypothetical protein
MYLCIFFAAAMADVHAELEHLETILHDQLAEVSISLPVFFGCCRQIKMYQCFNFIFSIVINANNSLTD